MKESVSQVVSNPNVRRTYFFMPFYVTSWHKPNISYMGFGNAKDMFKNSGRREPQTTILLQSCSLMVEAYI